MNVLKLREEFMWYLTNDGVFNQAIFELATGEQIFTGTDLDMVMEKFDKAMTACENLKED